MKTGPFPHKLATLLALSSVTLPACSDVHGSARPELVAPADERIADAAAELAVQLGDEGLRRALRARLVERSGPVPVGEVGAIAEALAERGLLEALPALEIVAPLGIGSFTDTTVPLVTYEPSNDDPTELVFFDATGVTMARPAKEAPRDYALMLRPVTEGPQDASEEEGLPAGAQAYTSSHPVYLRDISIWDTHECWGCSPEIYIKCKNADGDWLPKIWLDAVNDTEEWYAYNKKLRDLTDAQDSFVCQVMESDGSTSDDLVGTVTIYFNRVALTSSQVCHILANGDVSLGVSRTTYTKTMTVLGQTVQYAAGCPGYIN